MKIEKKLVTPMGDQSDYESDIDTENKDASLDSPIISTKSGDKSKEGKDEIASRRRIF